VQIFYKTVESAVSV